MRGVVFRATLLVAFLFLTRGAYAEESAGRRNDVALSVGLGGQYGGVGASIEGRFNFGFLGISAALGGPLIPTATLGLWLPGARFRFGLLAHAGAQPITTSCGTDPAIDPKPRCHAFLGGANVVLDHDIGDPNGFVLRYGLGLTWVGTGGAGVPLPGMVGLTWQW